VDLGDALLGQAEAALHPVGRVPAMPGQQQRAARAQDAVKFTQAAVQVGPGLDGVDRDGVVEASIGEGEPVGARKSIMGAELRVRRRDPRAAMIGA